MAEQDAIKIAVAVNDSLSPALKDMQRQLQGLTNEVKKTHTTGRVGAEAHSRSVQFLKRDLDQISKVARSGIVVPLGAMGLAVGGVAAAIGTVARVTFGASESIRRWTQLSTTSGLPVQAVRVLEALAVSAGSTKEPMDQGGVVRTT
jgi:hypothetical protein